MSQAVGSAVPRVGSLRPGKGFSYLLSAYSIQMLGEGVFITALPLMASRITTDPRTISAISIALQLPWILLALPGGLIVDRVDRRGLMIGAQATQAAMLLAVALVLILFDSAPIWSILLLAFVLGSGNVLFTGANQAVIADIVPPTALDVANGRSATAETIGRQFLGPALGGVLFAALLPLPFCLDAFTYALSLVIISRINRGTPSRSAPPTETTQESQGARALVSEATGGLRFIVRHPLLRTIVVLSAGSNFCVLMGESVLVLFAKDILHVGKIGYGALVASMAVGGIVGSLASRQIVRRLGAPAVAILVSLASALSLLGIGFLGHQPYVVVIFFWIWSAGVALWNVMSQTIRQRVVPREYMGRVTVGIRMIAYGALPLGALAGGLVASSFGLRATWILGGTLYLILTLPFIPAMLRWPSADEI